MSFHVAATRAATNTILIASGLILPSVPHTEENATGKKKMERGHYGGSRPQILSLEWKISLDTLERFLSRAMFICHFFISVIGGIRAGKV